MIADEQKIISLSINLNESILKEVLDKHINDRFSCKISMGLYKKERVVFDTLRGVGSSSSRLTLYSVLNCESDAVGGILEEFKD